MKKFIALSLLVFATNAFTQTNPGNVSGTVGKPASLDLSPAGGLLMRRVHTLGVDALVQQMQKDGRTEVKKVAMFNASGALVYNYETDGDDLSEWNSIGRNAGLQIVPYSVKVGTDGTYALAVNALSFKNMNTLEASGIDCSIYGDAFTVIDNMDFIVFKWDKNVSFSNLDIQSVDLANIDLKLDVMNSEKQTRFLALTAGASAGWTSTKLTLDSGEVVQFGDDENTAKKYFGNVNLRYGMEYNDEGEKGGRLNVKVGMNNTFTKSYFLDPKKVQAAAETNEANQAAYIEAVSQYEAANTQWANAKKDYEAANSPGGAPISTESYETLTGNKRPVAPKQAAEEVATSERVDRKAIYLTPSIEYSRRISKPGKTPVRIGARVSGNIPLNDTFKGGRINQDMTNQNRQLVTGSVFFNF